MLALFAERVRPEVRPLPNEAAQELDAVLTRRRQLLEMLTAERNRLGQVAGRGRRSVKKSLKAHIEFFERELRGADTDLGAMVRGSAAWREKDDLLRSAGRRPGALAHALGRAAGLRALSRRQIAKLAGVAPLARDSGTLRGHATSTAAGRRSARCFTWRPSWRRGATR